MMLAHTHTHTLVLQAKASLHHYRPILISCCSLVQVMSSAAWRVTVLQVALCQEVQSPLLLPVG